ncbi:EAL domain-containing protein [Rhodobacteraceae bacterium KMM 6894]|nr:EAL domain-containing protein [Rhodobacteraceae bacterium KMM 6894]
MAQGKASKDRGGRYPEAALTPSAVPLPAKLQDDTDLPGLILDHLNDGIALLDMQGRVVWINPALQAMLGWSLDDMRGRNPAELICPPDTRPDPDALAAFRYDLNASLFDTYHVTQHMRRDGSLFWNHQTHTVINLGPNDDNKMIVVTCRDISDQVRTQAALKKVRDDLEHAATHDDLTGLAKRNKLSLYLRCDPVMSLLRNGHVGVLQLDLDKFKDINDSLGHGAGDATLIHVADALAASAQPGDLACRTGGDEFLMICLHIPTPKALADRAHQVLERATRSLTWRDQIITPGISIGASMPDGRSASGEALIQHADQALYCAKNSGRGRVVIYNVPLGQRFRARQDLSRDLRAAVKRGQFIVHLQPILHLPTERITGCEALLRWQHPTRGLLPASSFLAAAKQDHVLADIDYLSMTAALDALMRLRAAGFHDICLSLNVSSSVLADINYSGLLDWALQSRGLPPGAICIEIQEATIMDQDDLDVLSTVGRLRRIGVRVALDDFGTGYAGLAHLATFDIDTIKLDHSMTTRLEDDPRTRIITRSIIHLCTRLGLEVVAEGVESQSQLDILRRAKCPFIQGYGLAHPMPVETFVDWLRTNTPLASPITMARPQDQDTLPGQAQGG